MTKVYFSPSTEGFYQDFQEHPEDCVAITEERYKALLEAQVNGKTIKVNLEGYPVAVEPSPNPFATWNGETWITDEKAQTEHFLAKKLEAINTLKHKAENKGAVLLMEYPDIEIASFHSQRAEAIAYNENPQTPTPTLNGIANARGLTLPKLVKKVLKKTRLFEEASGKIAGQRQAYMTKIEQAKSVEQIEDVLKEVMKW